MVKFLIPRTLYRKTKLMPITETAVRLRNFKSDFTGRHSKWNKNFPLTEHRIPTFHKNFQTMPVQTILKNKFLPNPNRGPHTLIKEIFEDFHVCQTLKVNIETFRKRIPIIEMSPNFHKRIFHSDYSANNIQKKRLTLWKEQTKGNIANFRRNPNANRIPFPAFHIPILGK